MTKIPLLLLLAGYLQLGHCAPTVDSGLVRLLEREGTANVLVTMKDRTSSVLEGILGRSFQTRGDRIGAVMEELKEFAAMSQGNVLSMLQQELSEDGRGISYQSFWISNQIIIRDATLGLIQKLVGDLPEIESITEEKVFRIDDPVVPHTGEGGSCEGGDIPWGIEKIEARRAQEANPGNDTVVAIIDTGVRGTHEALRNNHRRRFGWYDPLFHTRKPVDTQGHGTHVTGTIAGRTRNIGVSPDSQWMACLGCPFGFCLPASLLLCGQWVLCPWDGDGHDCSMAPDVVSNSWGWRGTGFDDWFNPVVDAWKAGGIIPVFGAGNSGPGCGSLVAPGDYQNAIGVGATDCNDALTNFSSLGPASCNASGIKPEVVAPGLSVLSASRDSDTAYASMDGTSMACPHVAGTVALMLTNSKGRLNFSQVKEALLSSSERLQGQGKECNGKGDTEHPNYHSGHGRINAYKAVEAAKGYYEP